VTRPLSLHDALPISNSVPVRISTSYFRVDVGENTRLDGEGFVLPTLQAAIEDLGHQFGHATETLTVRPPTPYEVDLLDIPGEWVVQVLRVSYSSEDVPVHALETICAATRHTFSIGQAVGSDQFSPANEKRSLCGPGSFRVLGPEHP